MIEDETLRLALEALEAMQMYAEAERKGLRICDEAIAAIKKALAQPEQEQGEPFNDPAEYDDYDAAVRRNEGKA